MGEPLGPARRGEGRARAMLERLCESRKGRSTFTCACCAPLPPLSCRPLPPFLGPRAVVATDPCVRFAELHPPGLCRCAMAAVKNPKVFFDMYVGRPGGGCRSREPVCTLPRDHHSSCRLARNPMEGVSMCDVRVYVLRRVTRCRSVKCFPRLVLQANCGVAAVWCVPAVQLAARQLAELK